MKALRIEPVPNSSLVRIAWTGGGEVPDELKGSYTTRTIAQLAIDAWKAANPDREVEVEAPKQDLGKGGNKKTALPMEPL